MKKPELLQLFIYCLLKANHEPERIIFNNKEIPILRGSFVAGRFSMADDLGCKGITLYKRLQKLKSLNFLTLNSNNKFTIVTIINYELYQSAEQNSNSKLNNGVTTEEQQSNTNKNEKNEKNIKDLSLEFEKFRQRYDEGTLKKIDRYFDILRTTRRSGKISDSIIEQVYGEMNKHPPVIVEYACTVIIGRPELQSKKENYFYGIMRNTEADEAERKLAKIGQASEEGRYKGIIL